MADLLKVLIVVRDQEIALSLSSDLRSHGMETVLAQDSILAMTVARKEKPDAVLLDAALPGGAQNLIKRIGSSLVTAAIPIIAITGDRGANREELFSAGARACLDQSVEMPTLVQTIREHAARRAYMLEAPPQFIKAPERMAALEKTGLLDSAPSDEFDSVTKLAAKILDVPTALVSLVDKDRQFFKSQIGLPEPWSTARQTPLSHSFCQWVVSGNEQLVVDDAREHHILRDNLAVRDLGVLAYAGLPLNTVNDQVIGSFCAIDSMPRRWKIDELRILRDLSRVVEASIALEQLKPAPSSYGPPVLPQARDVIAAIKIVAKGLGGAVHALRNYGPQIGVSDSDALMDVVDTMSQHLAQLCEGYLSPISIMMETPDPDPGST
ncbi:MAG: GAF domain-containing protein [Gammaproteobacteria bacterium]|nr:GAF domain-containing protein [Gammaproteobacteria bacterium]